MSDKLLNYLMIAGLFGILAVIGWSKLNQPKLNYNPAPQTTGAIVDDTFKQANPPLEQFYALMEAAPITKETFRIDPDFNGLRLIVTLNEPVENSQQMFFRWLADNGYGQIPAEKIILR